MNEPLIERGFAVVGAGAWLFGRAQPAAVRGTLRRSGLKGFICPDRGSLTRGELAGAFSHAESAKEISHAESAEFAESVRPSDLETGGEATSQKETPRTPRTPRDDKNQELGTPRAWCASSACPFLTLIDCGVPVSAVSDKVLVAPASARTGAKLVKVIPLSFARAIGITEFASPADRETVGPSDRETVGPSDRETVGPSDRETVGPSDRETVRPSDHQAGAWVVMSTRSRTTRVSLDDGESLGVRPEAAVAWTGPRPTGFCPRLRLLDILLPRGPRDLLLHFHGPAIVWIEGSEPRPLRQMGPRKAVF